MDHKTKQDQEHGVFGRELPDEGKTVSSDEAEDIGNSFKGFENMEKILKEIKEDAGALREMQAEVEKTMGPIQEDSSGAYVTQTEEEKADARTIHIGNVDHACTPEEVLEHFQSCGTISRVTISTDRFGQSIGFAFVEFFELESVQNSLLLNDSELHERQIKVSVRLRPKRINVSVMKQFRGRQCSHFMSGSRGVQKGARTRSKPGQRCPEKALPGPVHSLIKAARKRRGPARKPPLKPSPLRPPDFKG